MIERKPEFEEMDRQPLRLSDVTGGAALPTEKPGKKRRRRVLPAILAMLFLLGISGLGGYFLLRGKQVYLKADKQLEQKTASGADIRKAAYDSISGSLTAPATTAQSSGMATNASSEISDSGANSPKPALPDIAGGEKMPPQADPGIAETLTAPTETFKTKPSPLVETKDERSRQPYSIVASKPSAISANARSVRFASVVERERSASTELKSQAEREDSERRRSMDQSIDRTIRLERPGHRSSLPSFGAMLPVRLMGALYTMRTGSIARLELTRDLKAENWMMRRGTVFIGNVIGGDLDRAYLQIKGYIDPDTERLVKIEGELLGDDGGAGLRGKQRRVSPVWAKVLDRAAQAGVQIATGILNSRASSVIIATDPYGTIRAPNEPQTNNNRSFDEIGNIHIPDLPAALGVGRPLMDAAEIRQMTKYKQAIGIISNAPPVRLTYPKYARLENPPVSSREISFMRGIVDTAEVTAANAENDSLSNSIAGQLTEFSTPQESNVEQWSQASKSNAADTEYDLTEIDEDHSPLFDDGFHGWQRQGG